MIENLFSRTKIRHQIGIDGCWINDNDDKHAREEETAKNGEVNKEFIEKNNLSEILI